MRSTLSRFLIPLLLAAALPAQAVIPAQGDGTQNLTAPADDFGFASVGLVEDLSEGINISGVYLGSGWVLTAYHGVRDASQTGFQFGHIILAGSTYAADPSSAVRLQNPNSTFADLALFHLTTEPALPSLTIASSPPTNNLAVSMMGDGLGRDSNLTHWNVDPAPNPDVWTETASTGDAQGYKWQGSSMLRWGTNNIAALNGGGITISANDGFGVTTVFRTLFDNGLNDAQAAPGDSGGGVFWKVGGQWRLGGIMLFTNPLDGQPSGTAVFGDETYAANLSSYRNQIVAIVPEPSSAALAILGGAVLWRRRRR